MKRQYRGEGDNDVTHWWLLQQDDIQRLLPCSIDLGWRWDSSSLPPSSDVRWMIHRDLPSMLEVHLDHCCSVLSDWKFDWCCSCGRSCSTPHPTSPNFQQNPRHSNSAQITVLWESVQWRSLVWARSSSSAVKGDRPVTVGRLLHDALRCAVERNVDGANETGTSGIGSSVPNHVQWSVPCRSRVASCAPRWFVRPLRAIIGRLSITHSGEMLQRGPKQHQNSLLFERNREREREIEYMNKPLKIRSFTTDWTHVSFDVDERAISNLNLGTVGGWEGLNVNVLSRVQRFQ